MKRILAFALVLCWALSGFSGDAVAQGTKGALQVGVGVANTTGGPETALSYQVMTLHAAGFIFPSTWAAIIVDFSYGLPHTYEYRSGDVEKAKAQSSYIDGLLGVYKEFSDGGFIYLGAGAAVGLGSFDVTDDGVWRGGIDVSTSIGFACATGLALPLTDRMSAFINLRQRFIASEFKITSDSDTRTYDISNGGTEATVGLSWMFGG